MPHGPSDVLRRAARSAHVCRLSNGSPVTLTDGLIGFPIHSALHWWRAPLPPPGPAAQPCACAAVPGFKVAEDGVKIVTQLDPSGQPLNSGLAFVRFESAAEAQRAAAAQHRKSMGNRYIECLPVAPMRGAQVRRASRRAWAHTFGF